MDDEFKFADFFDSTDTDGEPTAHGIAQCLRMLADEAAALGLGRTLTALQAAIAVCDSESEAADAEADDAAPAIDLIGFRPAGTKLH